jgi:uncharacterized peroxidase-related enzyme
MTRIKTVPWSEADDRLRQARAAQHALYPPEYAEPVLPIDDDIAGIVASHSLIPDALYHAFATFGALMSPDLPLTRRQHEMIATVVSVTNRCFYCSTSHLEFLRRVTLDETLVDALRRDYRTAPIDAIDRVVLDYAAQITRDASAVTDEDHQRLRAAGFDDRGILQITLIAAWFNYINRVADALGVGTTEG